MTGAPLTLTKIVPTGREVLEEGARQKVFDHGWLGWEERFRA
jgi:hypothetical protein